MRSPLKRKTDIKDAMLMLKVFRGCIKSKIIPKYNSPCRKILSKIINDYQRYAERRGR